MAVLSWGKPKVEFAKLNNEDAPIEWMEMPTIVENSAQLNTEAGNKTEAIGEGGEVVDVRYSRSKYMFEMEVFIKKGDDKPIADDDGVIIDNYAVRLTPEDPSNRGFILDKTSVSCIETWTSADGGKWKYTFDGLKPMAGKILKPYTAPN